MQNENDRLTYSAITFSEIFNFSGYFFLNMKNENDRLTYLAIDFSETFHFLAIFFKTCEMKMTD